MGNFLRDALDKNGKTYNSDMEVLTVQIRKLRPGAGKGLVVSKGLHVLHGDCQKDGSKASGDPKDVLSDSEGTHFQK